MSKIKENQTGYKEVYEDDDYKIMIPYTYNDLKKFITYNIQLYFTEPSSFIYHTEYQTPEFITAKNLYIVQPKNGDDVILLCFYLRLALNLSSDKNNQFIDNSLNKNFVKHLTIEDFLSNNEKIFKFFNSNIYNLERYLKNSPVISYQQFKNFDKPTNVINGSFVLEKCGLKSLTNLPSMVDGNFYCSGNDLENLIGMPEYINGGVDCDNNGLKSLKGCTQSKIIFFNCSRNELTNLEGSPDFIVEHFLCGFNKLTSLVGAPEYIGGIFGCSNNQLTNLIGGPKIVNCNYKCTNNNLTSLEGAPTYVGGDFDCRNNPNLPLEEIERYRNTGAVKGKILCGEYINYEQLIEKGAPEIFDGHLICNGMDLTMGLPKVITGNLDCYDNCLVDISELPELIYGDFYCWLNFINKDDIEKYKNSGAVKGEFTCRDIIDIKYLDELKEKREKDKTKPLTGSLRRIS